jgi:hypothetical protein
MALDISALISSLSGWELAGYAALAAVAIGVAGESVHELTAWFKTLQWWKANGGKASALLLVAALAAELIIQVKTNSISGQIIAFLSDQAASTRERAAKLEAIMTGRRLSQVEINLIGLELRPFASRDVVIGSYSGDAEAARLGLQIKTALEQAGVHVHDRLGNVLADPGGVEFGVQISGLPSGSDFTTALHTSLGAYVLGEVSETRISLGGVTTFIMVALRPLAGSD